MRMPLVACLVCGFLSRASPGQVISSGPAADAPVAKGLHWTVIPTPFIPIPSMIRAPYMAVQIQESVETLADGTHLRRPTSETTTWRDSAGRIRVERRSAGQTLAQIEISDPVAGFRYALDETNRVVHRMPMTVGMVRAPSPTIPYVRRPAETTTDAEGVKRTFESMAPRNLFGVEVSGQLSTMVFPVGSVFGNDAPIKKSGEMWTAWSLGTVLESKDVWADGRETTVALRDLRTTEPDPALFRLPEGFRLADETGPFTITIPLK